MRKKQKVLTARLLQVISLGTLCAIGAFAMGIETAGDVHPFTKSEAALQEVLNDGVDLRGDVNGDGEIDARDAERMLQLAQHLDVASPDEIRRGDTNGNFTIDLNDVGYVLGRLSR